MYSYAEKENMFGLPISTCKLAGAPSASKVNTSVSSSFFGNYSGSCLTGSKGRVVPADMVRIQVGQPRGCL